MATKLEKQQQPTHLEVLGAELAHVRACQAEFEAKNKDLTAQVRTYLLNGVPVPGWKLQDTETLDIDTAILADTRIAKPIRNALAAIAVTALRDHRKHGHIPDDAWNAHVHPRKEQRVVRG